jgi:hypothetical protein
MKFIATSLPIFAALFFALTVRPISRFEGHKSIVGIHNETKVYLGFDRNEYPGDAALSVLRKAFSFSGYWLTPPPRETQNTWAGKKRALNAQGFGFLLLAKGRESSTVRSSAEEDGIADAREAARNASKEGFAAGSIVFLDIEEGGRLPPQFHSYLRAWADELAQRGFRPGVYCSGIPVDDGNGHKIVTADDIRSNKGSRDLAFWVFNDMCPPSLGCRTSAGLPGPAKSGVRYAVVWQFVRSPRPKETASACAGYANDENCYAAVDTAHRWHLDLDVASSNSPSAPR